MRLSLYCASAVMLFRCTASVCLWACCWVQEGERNKNRMLKNDLILRWGKKKKTSWCLSNMQNPPPTTCIIHHALFVMEHKNKHDSRWQIKTKILLILASRA